MAKHNYTPSRLDSVVYMHPAGLLGRPGMIPISTDQPEKTLGYCNPALILYNENVHSWEHDCITI